MLMEEKKGRRNFVLQAAFPCTNFWSTCLKKGVYGLLIYLAHQCNSTSYNIGAL